MNIRNLGVLGLVCLVAFSASAQQAGSPPKPHAGILKTVRGDVQLRGEAGATRAAQPGDGLTTADSLLTGLDSGASVVLRDGTTLVVGPASQLDLKQFQFDATTQDGNILISLLRGSLRLITGLIGKVHPEAIRVETQTATIGIRGTDFIVQADAQP